MSNLVDLNPYGIYNDLQGRPLNNGKVYIGLPNQDPRQYPAQVFWDAALTIPAQQPLRTVGGYVSRNGKPAKLYINGNYSLMVMTQLNVQVFYEPDYFLVGSSAVATINYLENGYSASVSDYAELRSFLGSNKSVYVTGYLATSTPSGIAGWFTYDPSDTTSADNGGTIIVSGTKRYKRQYPAGVIKADWFGADPFGLADSTTPIQNGLNYVYSIGGGVLELSTGTYLVTTIAKNWTSSVSVTIRGSGRRGTTIKKTGITTTPVFNFSAPVDVLETYSEIQNIRIQGISTCNGVQLTGWARFVLRSLQIDSCNVGIENIGSLVFSAYDCTVQSNVIGYRSRKYVSTQTVFCNLIQFFGGNFTANTSFGLDIGDSAGFTMQGVDVSANGTTGNTGTGGVIIRATVDDEIGFSTVNISSGWFEVNKGIALKVEDASGLILKISDVLTASNENCATIGAIFSSEIDNFVAGSAGDTVNISAARSTVSNSVIGVLNDTSTAKRHINVGTTAAQVSDVFTGVFKQMNLATQKLLYGRADQISGGTSDSFDYYLYGTGTYRFWGNGAKLIEMGDSKLGFFANNPIAKPTVSGSKAGNPALASLCAALANLGLITDATS